MAHFAVIALGADRPGIVAGLTEALFREGGNLEDVSSTILRGYFAMMLVVDAPDATAAGLEDTLAGAVAPLGVFVTVRDVEAGSPTRLQASHVLVAYAPDRPGIVARLVRLLADRGVNITDLSCRVVSEENPVYTVVAELGVPEGVDVEELSGEVAGVAVELGVDVSLRPIEVETL